MQVHSFSALELVSDFHFLLPRSRYTQENHSLVVQQRATTLPAWNIKTARMITTPLSSIMMAALRAKVHGCLFNTLQCLLLTATFLSYTSVREEAYVCFHLHKLAASRLMKFTATFLKLLKKKMNLWKVKITKWYLSKGSQRSGWTTELTLPC